MPNGLTRDDSFCYTTGAILRGYHANEQPKGGANRMMRLIGAFAIPLSGVIGIAIARGRDQMQRMEDLFQSYRTTL
jgi:hypothetical protein